MCRNIRVLHGFQPPTTRAEVDAAALQYVRKVSGQRVPSKAESEAFARCVAAIGDATMQLLETLPTRGKPRTREGELIKAKEKWRVRAARVVAQNASVQEKP
jgi:hypothetical protein